jgi:3-methyladenine DNA glycosylase/8-oxoguanine DNA glycosylase
MRQLKTQIGQGDGFCYDPLEAVKHLASVDSNLADLMGCAGPFTMQLRRMHNPFEALARNIIYQQLHGNAAASIHRRVLELFGKSKLCPQDILAAPEEQLRGAGLSWAKLAALKDLAAKSLDGTVGGLKLNAPRNSPTARGGRGRGAATRSRGRRRASAPGSGGRPPGA